MQSYHCNVDMITSFPDHLANLVDHYNNISFEKGNGSHFSKLSKNKTRTEQTNNKQTKINKTTTMKSSKFLAKMVLLKWTFDRCDRFWFDDMTVES